MRVLLERRIDATALSDHRWTPLHLASHEGHVEIVHVLLDHGVDVAAVEEAGYTALHAQ